MITAATPATLAAALLSAVVPAAAPTAVAAEDPQHMAQQSIVPTHPNLRWMGRTGDGPDGEMHLGYPGITLFFSARTGGAAIELWASSPDCFFSLSIDDGPFTILRAAAGQSTLTLAEGLDPAVAHRLVLVRRTESWQGFAKVKRVVLPASAQVLPAPPAPQRRLLLIGDSITCGGGVDEHAEGHARSNATGSFGMELGRRLKAEVHLVSYGGRGLVRDWQGFGNDKINNAPVFFERAMPDDPAAAWDHSRFTPHAVVIGLGTNDFNQGIPDEVVWVEAYCAFLDRIRSVHPGAAIILTNSPIFSSRRENGDAAKSAAIAHYLDEVVKRRRQAKDERVESVLLRYQPGTPKDAHPTGPQHQEIADDLEPVLRVRLGWSKE